MKPIFVQDYLEKMIFLENSLNHHHTQQLFSPVSFKAKDIIEVQRVAHQIAKFIRLDKYRFIVSYTKQTGAQAGQIELEPNENEVFIELSSDLRFSSNVVLAVLAHEITHKCLQTNNIHLSSQYENEILTDLAAVYLGLGKILLNGCLDNAPSFARVKVGYLSQSQLAFIYLVACRQRGIPEEIFMNDLTPEAQRSIQMIKQRYEYLAIPQGIRLRKEGQVNPLFLQVQKDLADLERNLLFIQQSYVAPTQEFLQTSHATLFHIQEGQELRIPANPRVAFLQTAQQTALLQEQINNLSTFLMNITELQQGIMQLTGKILSYESKFFLKESDESFTVIQCRNDGTKLRVPNKKKGVRVTCPTCKYRFIVNTTRPKIKKVSQKMQISNLSMLERWLKEELPFETEIHISHSEGTTVLLIYGEGNFLPYKPKFSVSLADSFQILEYSESRMKIIQKKEIRGRRGWFQALSNLIYNR